MVINLVISIALVRPLGISGVIIGTLIGYGITAPLYIRLVLSVLSMGVGAIRPGGDPARSFPGRWSSPRFSRPRAWFVQPAQLIAIAACCVPAGIVYVVGVVRFAMSAEERAIPRSGFFVPCAGFR